MDCKIMPKGIPKSGSRNPGAGRSKEYEGPTETIAFRVPITHSGRIRVMVNNYLKELKIKPQ
jgi:hypothetical protein